MNRFYLHVKKINEDGNIFMPAKEGDCGYDVCSTIDLEILPHERYNIPLGIALEFPDGYVCMVQQKSGIARNFGLDTIGNIIDSGYRGEIHAQIVNTSDDVVVIKKGMKIAQLIFLPFVKAEIRIVDKLTESDRGFGGFGSTGI